VDVDGAQDCAETGQVGHVYKNCATRRYLRLDAQGRVYREDGDGHPAPMPLCGGATLLILLAVATGHIQPGVPTRIRVPEGARVPATIDNLEVLAGVLDAIADGYATTRERSVFLPPG
jgi:hypothetical protein